MSKSERIAGGPPKTTTRSAAGAEPVKESSPSLHPNDSSREARISEAAFFKAAARAFAPGHEWDDWLAAEKEVDAQDGGSSGAALRPDPNSRIWSS
jgi:Protein of unknown function (DUF2934)